MEIQDEIDRVRARLEALREGEEGGFPGASTLVTGLEVMAANLPTDGSVDGDRLTLIVRGLSVLTDLLGPQDEKASAAEGDAEQEGLEQFVETFRREAAQRMQGLSIALMGIFGKEGTEAALEQSTDHLHAIRGGAAMLSLEDVAELAAAMEELLLAKKNVEIEHRVWPTKTVLRGYALLEEALEDEKLTIKSEDTPDVVAKLKSEAESSEPRVATKRQFEIADVSRETAEGASDSAEDEMHTVLEQPILIVDDIETIAASVAFILAELDVPLEIASHGEEAMQMLQDQPFSLVISDVDMPRMDGIALTRMIRSTEELSQLPVILLTSLDHPEERKAGMEAGATDYLIKGTIGGGELMEKVRDLLEVAPVVKRAPPQEKRKILVAEDTETVAASIAFVLSEGPYEIILATDGQDAMRKLQKQDFDLLITDMQMPYMSGTELVMSVRSDEALAQLPVVMLTSVQDDEMVAEAVDAGVDRYLIKGEIAGGKLLAMVDELLAENSL